MDFAIEQPSFAAILSQVKGCVLPSANVPILRHVLLTAQAGLVSVLGTDQTMEATASAPADVKIDGRITVPGAMLSDLVKRMPKGATIVFGVKDGRATVSAGRSRFQLPTLPAEDFPVMESGDGITLILPAKALHAILAASVTAAAPESESRWYLRGVYLFNNAGKLATVATDGHRMVYREAAVALPEGLPGIIAPTAAVNQILALTAKLDHDVTLTVSQTRLTLHVPGATFTTKVIEGSYPDWRRVMPEANGAAYSLAADDLSAALGRASVIARTLERGDAVGLAAGADGLRLLAGTRTSEEDGQAEEHIEAAINERLPELGMSASYLSELLGLWPGLPINLQCAGVGAPILFSSPGAPGLRCVLMPMRR